MPKNKNAFIRYRIIDTALRNRQKKYPTKKDLIEACSGLGTVSERTIDKDIYDMKYDEELGYFAPIEYDRKFNGYYYTDSDYSINQLPLKAEDLYALEFACSLLRQFEDIGAVKQFMQSVDKIENFISMKRIAGETLDDVIQTEKSLSAKGNEYLEPILKAINEKQVIILHYQSFTKNEINHYTFNSYVLKEYRNRWYVTGRDVGKNRIITLALERIKELLPTNDNFSVDETFNAKQFFKHSFGISVLTDYQPEKVVLKFAPTEAPYIKSQPLHETQRVISDTTNEFTISLDVIPTYELKSHILSYGDKVEVLEPKDLRDEHLKTLKSAMSIYKK